MSAFDWIDLVVVVAAVLAFGVMLLWLNRQVHDTQKSQRELRIYLLDLADLAEEDLPEGITGYIPSASIRAIALAGLDKPPARHRS